MNTTNKAQIDNSTTDTSTSTTTSQWQTYKPYTTEYGWECPRCGRINAPWVRQCDCSPSGWTISTTTTSGDEWWKPYINSDTFRIHPESDPIYTSSSVNSSKTDPNVTAWNCTNPNNCYTPHYTTETKETK